MVPRSGQRAPASTAGATAPAVLVEPGSYSCSNVGDVAMLQMAVARLVSLWPGACIRVFTTDAAALADHCPSTLPFATTGRDVWLDDQYLLGRLHRWIPAAASHTLRGLRRAARHYSPKLTSAALRWQAHLRGETSAALAVDDFADVWQRTDLVLLAGQASLADHAREHAATNLAMLEAAIERGIPTAMLGQGIGPLHDAELCARAREVLPRVDLIGLRERRAAPALLEGFGVDPARVVVTGDDAIELAVPARRAEPGDAIGVNLRVTAYAAVDHRDLALVRTILHDFARHHRVRFLPVPIAHRRVAQDPHFIRELLRGFDDQSDGGESLDNPARVIQQVARCRMVVTGAYHAAVFALALGIPAVCLARSPYYIDKFVGLADLFGAGCFLVRLDQDEVPARLSAALHEAWTDADSLRMPLRRAADQQCVWGQAAYGRLASLLGQATAEPVATDGSVRGGVCESQTVSQAHLIPERL